MNLLIVESPAKANTLNRFLGSDFSLMATKGHIKDLPKSKLGIDVKHNFKPLYEEVLKRKDVIDELIKKAKGKKQIYLATDPDREGEAISAHVKEILISQKPKIKESVLKRIVFHEITKEAVLEAIANPREVDENLVNAQTARRVLDRLVGYQLSPLLWRKVRRGLSAGRVQSVAVKLIVEKEREIEAFKSEEYWEIYGDFKTEKTLLNGLKLTKVNDKTAAIKNKNQAEDLTKTLKSFDYKIDSVEKKDVVKGPYPPFTTSTLSQAASRLLGWSSKRTMSLAQSLYDQGLITYHRTDSTFMAASAVEKLRKYVVREFGEKYLSDETRFFKTKSKVAQEAHEAIRPTNISVGELKEDEFEKDKCILYQIIWKRFAATQMANAKFAQTKINVRGEKDGKSGIFSIKGLIMAFDGWKKIYGYSIEKEVVLPEVSEGKDAVLINLSSNQLFTQPPDRFTEATLIKMLEKLGIGRPSTYAPTISTIQVRNYVEKDEGKFFPTKVGIAVNDFLIGNFPDVFEYEFTAEMEDGLDEIANGTKKWVSLIGDFYKPFEKKLKVVSEKAKRVKIETEKTDTICPECKKGYMVVRIGRFGKFLSCERFPDCKYKEKYLEKLGVSCPQCKEGDVIVKRTKTKKKFFGCSRYPECKWASWRKPEIVK